MHCTAFLLLGSNLGDRFQNLSYARSLLADNNLEIIQKSRIFETAAWGNEDQNNFYNQAILIETLLSPLQLLEKCQEIESKIGRKISEKWGPRIIDIDIAYYENLIIELKELSIPQKLIEKRKFALAALADIAPNKIHPILLKNNTDMLLDCDDHLKVYPIHD